MKPRATSPAAPSPAPSPAPGPGGDSSTVERFRREIRAALGGEVSVSLFWKGRVALYAILEALGVGPGDEVILPAFTCVVVPSAILYRGARPVYADVDPTSMNLDVGSVARRIGPRTRAILAQNTFGLSPDLDALADLAQRRGVRLIEDAAHGFGARYRGRPVGVSGDAAFFSSQWNKPFSTGLGGIAVTRSAELAERLARIEQRATAPSALEQGTLGALALVRARLRSPSLYYPAVSAYRFLGRHELVPGSSSGWELSSPSSPSSRASYLKGYSPVQARLGLRELPRMEARLAHRARIAGLYRERLGRLGFSSPSTPDWADHGHLRYPIRVRRRDALLADAEAARVEIGDWFVSPLHPIREQLERWHYRWGENPAAEALSREVVTLPTHESVDEAGIERLCSRLDLRRYA